MKFELKRKKVTVNEKTYTNYYLVSDNGNWVAIKPAFLNDYKVLYVLSESTDQDKEQKEQDNEMLPF